MSGRKNDRSIELLLLQLVDDMVLEPEQKKLAVRAMKELLHANKVSNLKSLNKAMNKFLRLVVEDVDDSSDDD